MSSDPRIVRASFTDGARWLTDGANLVGRGGAGLVRVAAWLIVLSLLQAVPLIGLPLMIVLSPVLTAGLLGIFRRLDGGAASPAGFPSTALFDGFREPSVRGRLLGLGGLLLLGLFAAVLVLGAWLSPQMDLEALNALMADPQRMEQEPDALFALFEGVNLLGGIALAAGVLALVLGALYFAVPLVFFWRWPLLAALLWSLRAALVNWAAFLGYALVLVGVLFLAGLVFIMLGGLLTLALGAFGQLLVQVLSVLISLFVQLLFAAAQWRAFRQVFPASGGPGEPSRPGAGGGDASGGESTSEASSEDPADPSSDRETDLRA
ncbi:BPSS1780 family membrane protein [Halomonas denitrificans]|nr:hypothetical protein [Halomonas denitrificans]